MGRCWELLVAKKGETYFSVGVWDIYYSDGFSNWVFGFSFCVNMYSWLQQHYQPSRENPLVFHSSDIHNLNSHKKKSEEEEMWENSFHWFSMSPDQIRLEHNPIFQSDEVTNFTWLRIPLSYESNFPPINLVLSGLTLTVQEKAKLILRPKVESCSISSLRFKTHPTELKSLQSNEPCSITGDYFKHSENPIVIPKDQWFVLSIGKSALNFFLNEYIIYLYRKIYRKGQGSAACQ